MLFQVLAQGQFDTPAVYPRAILKIDNWNDWFEFTTLYYLTVHDSQGTLHRIGGVKIGEVGMQEGQLRPNLPDSFDALSESCFSLGQDDSYYENLNKLGEDLRDLILSGLRDVAADEETFERALRERVTGISLMRSVSTVAVRGQFRRLARGGTRLSHYRFTYSSPVTESVTSQVDLSFNVIPESNPPTNIHVVIGRNGVGKTHMLNRMSRCLIEEDPAQEEVGTFTTSETVGGETFANLVSVTFSAFDPFEPLPEQKDKSKGRLYSYIGLRQTTGTAKFAGQPKSSEMLTEEFAESVRLSAHGAKGIRWRKALKTLEADPIFEEAEVSNLADHIDDPKMASDLLCRKPSSLAKQRWAAVRNGVHVDDE